MEVPLRPKRQFIVLGLMVSAVGLYAIFTGKYERVGGGGIHGYPARIAGTAMLAWGLYMIFYGLTRDK